MRGVRLPGLHLWADALRGRMDTGTWGPCRPRRRCADQGAHPADPSSGNQAPWDEVVAALNPRGAGLGCSTSAYGTRRMAYRAVDHYVSERVRHFLRRRHKVPSRGTRRFSADVPSSGSWACCRCRRFHLAPPAHASGVKPVREPDAGKPHVRFDEEGRETRDGPLGGWTPDPKGRKQWGAAGPVHDRARPLLYRSGCLSESGRACRRAGGGWRRTCADGPLSSL